MAKDTSTDVLTKIVTALKDLDVEAQKRTLTAVIAFLDIQLVTSVIASDRPQERISNKNKFAFSEDRTLSPKEFLRDKQPITDLERVACLAYYLTHYRDQPHFKTVDLSTLNTEAAQPKFSNPALAANNSLKASLLVQAGKGNKQLSSAGETFVQLLPDRDAAKESLRSVRRRKGKKHRNSKSD